MKDAILYLEDGTAFHGQSLGVTGETAGEVVFNTAMSGYQEVLTDPSYAGQIVVMTYPLIGNYGVNDEDVESSKVHVKSFVVKEFCRRHSNHRATRSLVEYLNDNKIIALEGIDTRALTRHLRVFGAMKGYISTEDFDPKSLAAKIAAVPSMEGADWVKTVTAKDKYVWPAEGQYLNAPRFRVAAIDCGIKLNILRILAKLGCEIHVFPATAAADEIKAVRPDGLFLSNGPGDPAVVNYVIETVRKMFGVVPIFGICLGHQILGLALGGKTYKLRFGHHGVNHPVKDLLDNRIGITSQNHGFCVDINSLKSQDVEMIDVNLNDQTVEGLRHKKFPILSVQHHPEAAPGPHDAQYLFKHFIEMMKKNKESEVGS
ncbi:MAG: glutamine-hydrolyzing carbamoyl-phosphate synthase small subunit [Candidatus Omnitrophota bacterium]|nr:glutamine-hydrolyzing carbamoyl-phosphate synthase small subunit [Candidatus Omnitrophota bacterium]MDZ4242025.1 glutamine-hydrolyzing carbamoyl-phosphate synthase small subunit [Candidatus Omnitrophota bacterium]